MWPQAEHPGHARGNLLGLMIMNSDFHTTLVLFTTSFMGFFAMMNPVANTPVFLGLTDGFTKEEKIAIAFKASFIAFLITLTFCILGGEIFDIFGISIDSFKVAGGVLVATIGMNMLHGSSSKVHSGPEGLESKKQAALNISVSPLALPILAGPGTIATAISYTAHKGFEHIFIVSIAIFMVLALNFVMFIMSEKVVRFLGDAGIQVITKLMGLILAVIGVQMLSDGVFALIKLNLH